MCRRITLFWCCCIIAAVSIGEHIASLVLITSVMNRTDTSIFCFHYDNVSRLRKHFDDFYFYQFDAVKNESGNDFFFFPMYNSKPLLHILLLGAAIAPMLRYLFTFALLVVYSVGPIDFTGPSIGIHSILLFLDILFLLCIIILPRVSCALFSNTVRIIEIFALFVHLQPYVFKKLFVLSWMPITFFSSCYEIAVSSFCSAKPSQCHRCTIGLYHPQYKIIWNLNIAADIIFQICKRTTIFRT